MLKIGLMAGLMLLSASAFAQSCPSNNSIFSCSTTNGKVVQVCDEGKTLSYAFGRAGQTPELSFSVPREKASTFQWEGMGRYISYSVTLPNGATHYTTYFSVDRSTEDLNPDAGINVETNAQLLAQVKCKPGTLRHNMVDIKLPKTAQQP